MLNKDYLFRQVMALLRMAKLERDPTIAAGLTGLAADMTDKIKEPSRSDSGLAPPDVVVSKEPDGSGHPPVA
jgi:hypothetical protein